MKSNDEFLRRQLAQTSQQAGLLNAELLARAAPTLAQLIDALSQRTLQSKQGDLQSHEILKRFVQVLDEARAEASRIAIIRPNGNVARVQDISPLEQTGSGELPDTDEPSEGGNVIDLTPQAQDKQTPSNDS